MNTVEAPASIAFRVHAIPSRTLAEIRLAGHDRFGNELTPIVDDDGGAPLRCCLRRSTPGEPIYLIAYRPFTMPGPYAEVGPVFVHARPCPGYRETGAYPAAYRDWPLRRPHHQVHPHPQRPRRMLHVRHHQGGRSGPGYGRIAGRKLLQGNKEPPSVRNKKFDRTDGGFT
jgi:hypothetical protein